MSYPAWRSGRPMKVKTNGLSDVFRTIFKFDCDSEKFILEKFEFFGV